LHGAGIGIEEQHRPEPMDSLARTKRGAGPGTGGSWGCSEYPTGGRMGFPHPSVNIRLGERPPRPAPAQRSAQPGPSQPRSPCILRPPRRTSTRARPRAARRRERWSLGSFTLDKAGHCGQAATASARVPRMRTSLPKYTAAAPSSVSTRPKAVPIAPGSITSASSNASGAGATAAFYLSVPSPGARGPICVRYFN
jgi:hypothetical protein